MPALFKFKVQSLKFKIALFLLFFLLYALRYTLYPDSAFAQTNTPLPSPIPVASYIPLPQNIPQSSPLFANLQLLNLAHGLSCILSGISFTNQPCIDYVPKIDALGKIQNIPVLSSVNTTGGLLGAVNSVLVGMFVNPPLSTSDYLNSVADGFGIIPPSHAQSVPGSGNNVLNPILPLWQVSRNFAYLVMILVFVAVGIMIMFRSKINPQTVISVQAALPGLVIGLILITFSYFAAALITDLAFIGTDVVGYYFNAATGQDNGSLLQRLQTENMVSIGSSFVGRLSGSSFPWQPPGDLQSTADIIINNLDDRNGPLTPNRVVRIAVALIAYPVGSAIGKSFGSFLETFFPTLGKVESIAKILGPNPGQGAAIAKLKALEISAISGPVLGAIFAGIGYQFPGFVIGFAFYLIALFAVLYAVFRLLLALINTYLSLILLTITGPFQFLVASLPGRSSMATNWARNMLASALTFPAVIAVFYFAAFLIGEKQIQAFQIGQKLDVIGQGGALPLFGGFDLSFVRMLLAIGAVLATPKIPELISKSIGKPGALGGAFDQGINQAIGQGQKYSNQATSGAGKIQSGLREDYNKWRGQDPYPMKSQEAQLLRTATGRNKLPEWLSPREWTSTLRDTGAQNEYLRKMNQPAWDAAMRINRWESENPEIRKGLPSDYQTAGYIEDQNLMTQLGNDQSTVFKNAVANPIRSGNTGTSSYERDYLKPPESK